MADAVDGGNVQAVGDRVAALDRLPRLALRRPVFVLLMRVPADGGGVEENTRTGERGQARSLRVPLVPADQSRDTARSGVEGGEPGVPGREVELLVVSGVVGDVHLAVEPDDPAVLSENGRAVVVQPGGAPLEDRRDDRDAVAPRGLTESLGRRSRHRLGQVEDRRVLALAEVTRPEELRQADDPGPGARRLADPGNRPVEVLSRVFQARHLDEPDRELLRHRREPSRLPRGCRRERSHGSAAASIKRNHLQHEERGLVDEQAGKDREQERVSPSSRPPEPRGRHDEGQDEERKHGEEIASIGRPHLSVDLVGLEAVDEVCRAKDQEDDVRTGHDRLFRLAPAQRGRQRQEGY